MVEEVHTIRCPILNDTPENKGRDVIIEFEDRQPEFIMCSEFIKEQKMCRKCNQVCLYSRGWKEL